ncbi:helix-turn-helix domain-containing protein [Granulicatella adiacens]|jgi:transcriptional regulator with XRE-family HTH domain|uniref:helix-turn-helix domain-containing protein n=1 Tax=Granulicatella adiacens TaxID=46124 RepID=UPI00241EAA33|nr:helix-turn-helix transcriptional regulator [Granulicatella adiacens]
MIVNYKIKELREKMKISQEELAAKSGVSRALISGLETGTIQETSTATLKKLAIFFNVKVSELFF